MDAVTIMTAVNNLNMVNTLNMLAVQDENSFIVTENGKECESWLVSFFKARKESIFAMCLL